MRPGSAGIHERKLGFRVEESPPAPSPVLPAMVPERDIGALLAEASWLSGLARRLVHDVHLAEDLAQDAWVSALERRPDAGRSLRGWLATALGRRRVDAARAQQAR